MDDYSNNGINRNNCSFCRPQSSTIGPLFLFSKSKQSTYRKIMRYVRVIFNVNQANKMRCYRIRNISNRSRANKRDSANRDKIIDTSTRLVKDVKKQKQKKYKKIIEKRTCAYLPYLFLPRGVYDRDTVELLNESDYVRTLSTGEQKLLTYPTRTLGFCIRDTQAYV